MRSLMLVAALALGCGSEFSAADSEGSGGSGGVTPGAMGAAELRLSPPALSVPNIGSRTSCAAGTTGTYTYFLGATPSGDTVDDRVLGAMIRSDQRFSLACQVRDLGDSFFVSVEMTGTDANSRRVDAGLSFTGTVPKPASTGLTDVFGFASADTQELWTSADVGQCVLGPVSAEAGELIARVTCPAVVSFDDDVHGCEIVGAIAVSGCSR